MGRSRTIKPRRPGLCRRDFLKRTGAALLSFGALPLLQSCGGHRANAAPLPVTATSGAAFGHGVASGDPLSDRVILWTRITTTGADPVALDFVVATDAALSQIVRSGQTTTDLGRDHTVKIDVDGLQPDTTYYYRFASGGVHSPIGRTKTLPLGDTGRVRLAVVTCASLAQGYFNAYRRIAERADLDLVLHLGDYIYEFGNGEDGNVRLYEPPNEIVSLSDYRTRYAQYRRDADLQELHRQHPMVAIWDDHEFADNAYADGALNHTAATEGAWPARVAAALQAYYEWMPIRVVDPANLRKNNRSFALGNLADLLLLEERLNARSGQLPADGTLATFTQDGAFADPTAPAARCRGGILAGRHIAQLEREVETDRTGGDVRATQGQAGNQRGWRRHLREPGSVGRLSTGARPCIRHPEGRCEPSGGRQCGAAQRRPPQFMGGRPVAGSE